MIELKRKGKKKKKSFIYPSVLCVLRCMASCVLYRPFVISFAALLTTIRPTLSSTFCFAQVVDLFYFLCPICPLSLFIHREVDYLL